MKKALLLPLLWLPMLAQGNDSTGFVSTGGIEYIKNDKIAMQSEDLFISQDKIKVKYAYKNLTKQDVTETILFPLPPVFNYAGGNFADSKALIDNFKILADGKAVQPEIHVRAFLHDTKKASDGVNHELIPHDVTEVLRGCGLTDEEMSDPWTQKFKGEVESKILNCKVPELTKFNLPKDIEELLWSAQIVYSWQQTFKADGVTEIYHEYAPLVGGSVSIHSVLKYEDNEQTFSRFYCLDQRFKDAVTKIKQEYGTPYSELGYILTTGANWAKPIEKFTLTVERKKNQLVSFCWDGELRKVKDDGNVVQFQATEKHFLPKRDLNFVFVER